MKNNISFRKIKPDDTKFLKKVYASTREEELAVSGWTSEQKDIFITMQFDAQHMYYMDNYKTGEFQVILIDNENAGRLYIEQMKKEIRIIDITLHPKSGGSGYGTSMLTDILARGKKTKLPVTIHVETNNPALGLYKRLGFNKINNTGVYFLMEAKN